MNKGWRWVIGRPQSKAVGRYCRFFFVGKRKTMVEICL